LIVAKAWGGSAAWRIARALACWRSSAHPHFGQAHLHRHVGSDPPVGAQGQDQAARDGMAVDRRDQWLGPAIERAEGLIEGVDQAALTQPVEGRHRPEIEAGRKGRPVGRDHRRPHAAVGGEAFEQGGQLFEQVGVHRVHRRTDQGHEGDARIGKGEVKACHGRKITARRA
jgi:hypothetical protein